MFENDRSIENESPEETIRVAAYYKWLDAGRPDGRDVDFWCEAEREHALVKQAMSPPSTDGAPAHHQVIIRPKALPSPARRGSRETPVPAVSRQKA
jgi:hypothetical protein